MTKLTRVTEYAADSTQLKVDKESHAIKGVKIIGNVSTNGRTYPQSILAKAKAKYENREVNVNHSGKLDRAVGDRFGWLSNIREGEGGLYGDLNYLESHPQSAMIVEAAERNPKLFGLSHVADCRERKDKAGSTIESIEQVFSVDVVANPATVNSLFEGRSMKTYKQVREALPEKSPAFKFFKEMEELGAMPAEMEAPAEVAAAQSPEDALAAGFKAAIVAIIDDSSMDLAAKKKKIGELLTMQDKAMAKDEPAEASGGNGEEKKPDEEKKPEEEKKAEESKKVAALEKENKALKLCSEMGLKLTPVQIKAMCGLDTEAEMKTLAESWTKPEVKPEPYSRTAKPISAPPIREGKKSEKPLPTDKAALRRELVVS